VPYANDELFAERENLIKPGPAVFSTEDFGTKGKVYDGWETRRGENRARLPVVRARRPGIVRGVVIDTPGSRELSAVRLGGGDQRGGLSATGGARAAELADHCERSPLRRRRENSFRWPPGSATPTYGCRSIPTAASLGSGLHGEVVPDPRLLRGHL